MAEAPLASPGSPRVITAARGAAASSWYAVGAGALIAGGGHRLPAAEPGAVGVYLVEPAGPQCLADLGSQICLPALRLWPDPQAGSPPQALDRPGQQRRPPGVALGERELGERGQDQGHVLGAVGRQAP